MRIHLLHTPAQDGGQCGAPTGAYNMALDEALLARARRTHEVVVRIYTWTRPTLSFGRHQRARGTYDGARAAARGIDVVRRPTGGRAVLHGREITYSVTAPLGALAPASALLRGAYARINRMLAAALRALGVAVHEAAPAGRARHPDAAPCFETPSAGELVVGDGADARKLVGSAQWRDDGALLQHGSILGDDDQTRLAECAVVPLPPIPAPATLRAVLGRVPSADEVAGALAEAAHTLDPGGRADVRPVVADLGDPVLAAEVARLVPHYADPDWTWRR